jgi:hypothetical protein
MNSPRRFLILVRSVVVGDRLLLRGDVVTDALLGPHTESLLQRGLVAEGDYSLAELTDPRDPWPDGRWLG